MKRLSLFILIPLSFSQLRSSGQTGPAGVGTNAINIYWLDANTSVAVTGAGVTSWTDRSGNLRVASPNAVANQPTLVTGSVNGNRSLNFDGLNDELRIPDAAALDIIAWHLFIVVRADVLKNYNGWLIKGDDSQENYEMLTFADGLIHTPTVYTDATRTIPNSAPGQLTTTEFNIFEYSYTAGVAAIRGRNVFKNAANIITDAENKTPQVNNMPVYVGNEKATTGRFVDGDIAEVIAFNGPLNSARRIIVNNYLSAKYDIALSTEDFYAGDNGANGHFDYEMGGIGQSAVSGKYVTGDNTSVSSAVTGGLEATEGASTFGDGEYLMFGHQSGANYMDFTDITGMSAGPLVGRWNRSWYFDWTHSAGSETVDLTFDISDGGMTATPAAPLSNYKLLYRAGTSGVWTEVMNATSITGDRIFFNEVPNTIGDGYVSIGTLNNTLSPLPVELLNFSANLNGDKVELAWATATETNNDFFTVEKTKDGLSFAEVLQMDGAGNSTSTINYFDFDPSPYAGLSYYRLKQTDFNGNENYSGLIPVDYQPGGGASINLFPNPAEANSPAYLELNELEGKDVLVVLRDITGKELYSKVIVAAVNGQLVAIDPEGKLARGAYLVTAASANKLYSKRLIVK